jgi:hypothetical protein
MEGVRVTTFKWSKIVDYRKFDYWNGFKGSEATIVLAKILKKK